MQWHDRIGRRLKLRDLHTFRTVAQRGSMAKAAAQLGVSQPAVSEVIGSLEEALGVRLLDRSARGFTQWLGHAFPRSFKHDPEKWIPVFGKDHAS